MTSKISLAIIVPVKSSTRIWVTGAILVLAIIGCVAGLVIISNHQAKIEVRQNRVVNIDTAIRRALDVAKEAITKRFGGVAALNLPGNAQTVDVGVVRQLLEKPTHAFNFFEEEVSALNSQRRQNEREIFDFMGGVNECTILTVVCLFLGLYAVFWFQRYT